MKLVGFLVAFFAFTQSAEAHVPNIASYHLIPGNDAWRLEVSMSTAGMHQALQAARPGESLSTLTPEAYENVLLDALRAGIELRVDGNPLVLDHPTVDVRSHASRVVFIIAAPESAHRIDARIDALSARGDQNNVFRFLGQRALRVVLKSDNDFRGELELSPRPTLRVGVATPRRKARLLVPVVLIFLGLGLTRSGLRSIRALA